MSMGQIAGNTGGTMVSRTLLSIAIVAIGCSPVLAATEYGSAANREGLYICTLDMGGGVNYSVDVDLWSPSTFRTSEKFLFNLKFLEEIREGNPLGSPLTMDRIGLYEATMKYAGTDMSETCGTVESPSRVDDHGSFECSTYISDYRINFTNLKFVSIRVNNYLGDNLDNADVQASLTVGSCTKVD